MNILGVSDGVDGGAALAVDDQLVAVEQQESFDRIPRSRAFPWGAVDDVLRRGHVDTSQVQMIAVAGRITPPFFLRRHPSLHRLLRDPFSPALDLGVFYQATLRQTGLAALEADRAADWLAARFERRGFRGRLFLVDVHTALANAAYRTQTDDDLLVLTLHPLGDGVSFAVHRANLGQIDRVFEQKGFSTLHVHLLRCAAALGFDDVVAMWRGVGPRTDPELLAALERHLHLDGRKLSHNRYPLPPDPAVYRLLERAEPAVGAASVRANLSRAVCGLVQHHVRQYGCPRVALAGEVFQDRRLVADIAALDEVRSVWCPPDPGPACLAAGAAAYAAGLPMRSRFASSIDPELPADAPRPDPQALAASLRRGERLARYSGESDLGPWSRGDRCLWSLAGPGRPASLRAPLGVEVGVWSELVPALQAGSVMPQRADGTRTDGVMVPPGSGLLADVLAALGEDATVMLEPLREDGVRVASVAAVRRAAAAHGASRVVFGSPDPR